MRAADFPQVRLQRNAQTQSAREILANAPLSDGDRDSDNPARKIPRTTGVRGRSPPSDVPTPAFMPTEAANNRHASPLGIDGDQVRPEIKGTFDGPAIFNACTPIAPKPTPSS
jgi:hypothetical protein